MKTHRQTALSLNRPLGFTLVEVLVAMSVSIIVILGFTTAMNFSARTAQSAKAVTDFNSLVSTLQVALSNSSNCQTIFGGLNLNSTPAVPSAISPVQTVSPLKTQGSTGAVLAQVGPTGSTLNITNLEFNYVSPLTATNQYLVTLHLAAQKVVGGQGSVGSQTLTHDFQISVTIDPAQSNKIIACSGQDILWKKAANGTDIYYSGGKVGVGTSSPSANLDVSDSTSSGTITAVRGYVGNLPGPGPATTGYGGSFRSDMATTNNIGVIGFGCSAGGTAIGGDFGANCGGAGPAYGVLITNPAAGSNNWALYSTATAPSYFSGNVGIGTTAPAATLDVAGGIRPGPGTTGAACSPEGTFAYDSAAHAPVYCNSSGKWATLGGGPTLTTLATSVTLGANYTYTYAGSKKPIFLSAEAFVIAYGNTICTLDAQWLDGSGTILKPWTRLSGINPNGAGDGGAGLNDSFFVTVPFIGNTKSIQFRKGGNGQQIMLNFISLMEQ